MLIKKIWTLSLVVLFIQTTLAQDIHFTQFYNASLSLNPALAGSMEKKFRINANERTQWSNVLRGDAYSAYNLAVDKKISLKNGDAFGMGLNAFADRAGELNFGSTQGLLSFAYHKQLGSDTISKHTISFAAEFGIVERKVNPTNARWPSQHDGNGGFCEACPIDYNFGFNPRFLHSDVSIGLNWRSKLSEAFSFSIGAAFKHINQPNVSFYGDQSNEALTLRSTIHAEGQWKIGKVTQLIPRILYIKQGNYNQTTPGLDLGFDLGKSILYVGHYYRIQNDVVGGLSINAFITTFGMTFNAFRFGLSYDVPTNNERQAGTYNGGFELTTAVLF